MGADLELALAAADLADGITLEAFRRPSLAVEMKADETPVSEADHAAEAAIRELLGRKRPGDGILGEEMGSVSGSSRRWVLDPIDGTANFIRGVPVWGTLIGLEIDGVISVGVVSAPALGRRWWAERGGGAFAGPPAEPGKRIKVSEIAQLGEATIAYGSVADFPDGANFLSLHTRSDTTGASEIFGPTCLSPKGLAKRPWTPSWPSGTSPRYR